MRLFVDSSVWIDFFNGSDTRESQALERMLGVGDIVVGDLVVAEVLQGFRSERDFNRALELLRRFDIVAIGGADFAVMAARNYRRLRKSGVTVRKTVDVWIGTWCVQHSVPLLFSDRDFEPMVKHLGLKRLDPGPA